MQISVSIFFICFKMYHLKFLNFHQKQNCTISQKLASYENQLLKSMLYSFIKIYGGGKLLRHLV